jgi:hypothetical protein
VPNWLKRSLPNTIWIACVVCVLNWTGCSTKPVASSRPCEVAIVTKATEEATQVVLSPAAQEGDILITGQCYLNFITYQAEVIDLRSRH